MVNALTVCCVVFRNESSLSLLFLPEWQRDASAWRSIRLEGMAEWASMQQGRPPETLDVGNVGIYGNLDLYSYVAVQISHMPITRKL